MSYTFTKLFSSITESTVWCEPDATRLAWITMLAMADRKGRVFASIPGLANRARITVGDARMAISTFLSPDPDSRTPDHEGRRIEPIDGGWHLLNYDKYRSIQADETILESKRRYINSRRDSEKSENVDTCRSDVENVDVGRYKQKQKQKQKQIKNKNKNKNKEEESENIDCAVEATARAITPKRFTPPTVIEVREYCRTRPHNSIDPQRFVNHYDSNGWMVGRNKMRDWRAAIRTWEANDSGAAQSHGRASKTAHSARQEVFDVLTGRNRHASNSPENQAIDGFAEDSTDS